MPLTVQEFLSTLTDRQMWLRLGRDWKLQVRPPGSLRKLSRDEKVFLHKHDAELKTLAAAAPERTLGWIQPRAQPESQSQPVDIPAQQKPAAPVSRSVEQTPEVYARGVRITEAHVEQAMEAAGDLEDYRKGRMTKVEAYERARVRQRQLQDPLWRPLMRGQNPRRDSWSPNQGELNGYRYWTRNSLLLPQKQAPRR